MISLKALLPLALLPAFLAAMLAGGCANINAQWVNCERNSSTFEQLADCTTDSLQASVSERTRERAEARARRYSLAADQLIEKLRTGILGEADARTELHRALDEMLDEERDERLTPLRAPPKSITCSPTSAGVSCTGN